ncbi:MAG: Guanylate kinase [Firmicutes bacterium ADurb.Bin354]|nr:MAG: Guanylate kinase [Firmicutes bacterium ADurb.Bin354]
MRQGALVVISGFAGAGKGTLVKELMKRYDNYALSVSMTTRSPRPGEKEGESYFFVTKEQFEKTIEENGFIEYAQYVGNYYGTPRAYVEEQMRSGKDVILEIEIQGAHKVRELYPDAILIFVTPPSAQILKERLTGRGTETAEVIKKRMDRAAQESEGIEDYDYIAVNDDIETCVSNVRGMIEASHFRPALNEEFISQVRADLEKMATE